ncbi:MAG: hypothetical protein OZ917_05220 [Candidatus Brocadiaceae bacterium]|nr:hypothetical protein [Candidatus Brocadiaceae bacterium]
MQKWQGHQQGLSLWAVDLRTRMHSYSKGTTSAIAVMAVIKTGPIRIFPAEYVAS